MAPRSIIQEMRDLLGEDAADLDALADLCEEAGFEVPEGIDAFELLAGVEEDVLGTDLDEKLMHKLKSLYHKVKAKLKGKKIPKGHSPKKFKPKKSASLWTPGRSRAIAARM
jgi:hypothetical protein